MLKITCDLCSFAMYSSINFSFLCTVKKLSVNLKPNKKNEKLVDFYSEDTYLYACVIKYVL